MKTDLFMCDKDLARLLNVSQATITRSAKGERKDSLNAVKPVFVGGARRWNKFLVANALGLTMEQLDGKLK